MSAVLHVLPSVGIAVESAAGTGAEGRLETGVRGQHAPVLSSSQATPNLGATSYGLTPGAPGVAPRCPPRRGIICR